ncbi:CoA transferase [Escherichia albertii]|uniref:CaiB/BaiF CoA transferase family protein n=1 Tax=Escherichia albertii TaxID=208962 RepID=UPI0010789133|nr:CoA transferase [Escherichia albertii]EFA6624435.1 CoA transferase [Escherichia albertii]EFA7086458.1 CoA transferase [Escherichia albertii]EFF0833758.1 CoA transferase [Escherichia albertii]EFF1429865.1 CoA transferase [Escherichia albertii]EFL5787281.1 CoA transferase [Escherichia albertii]
MENKQGALAGLQVLDLTRVLAGPFCTMMLADMGAEVIKIERPGVGDDTRQFAPFKNGESAYYMNLNRNKKGITLNLKGRGKALFLELVKTADIVVENYRPGTMEKLGLGHDELKKVNPRIIYCAISGFGHTGPYSQRPGYDIIGQAMGGLMSTTGWPGGEPTRSGTAMSDVLAGLSATIGTLAALRHRDQTGEGQKVDIALVDSVVASLEIITQIYLTEGRIPERIGNRYESCYPYDTFKARDGDVVIAAANDKLWSLVAQTMGQPELATREEFNSNPLRVKNHALLKPIIEIWSRQYSVNEIVDCMLNAGVPAAPINNIDQLVSDPHIADAREMFIDVEHPIAGTLKLTGSHIKLTSTPTGIRTPSPLLGQHNQEIYSSRLGLDDAELAQLRAEGIL